MPLQGKRAIKAAALSLQISLALFNFHLLTSRWLPLFATNTPAYSQDVPKLSGAKPEPGLLPKQPGMFNSLGQLQGYVLCVVTVSMVQLPAHPSSCKRCPAASLLNKSQCLSGCKGKKERKQQTEKKEGRLGDVREIIVL